MKKQLTILATLLFLFLNIQNVSAVKTPVVDNAKVSVNNQQIDFTTTSMSVDNFLNMSAKEIGQKRGKKLKLKERLALMIMKRQIKKAIKKGENVEDMVQQMNADAESDNTSTILGFLLGFLLGLIGVLLAYIFYKQGVKGAWYGFLALLVLILLAVIL